MGHGPGRGPGHGCGERQKRVGGWKMEQIVTMQGRRMGRLGKRGREGRGNGPVGCAFARPLSTAPDNDTLFFFLLGSGSRACRHGNSSHPALASLPELQERARTRRRSENLRGPMSTCRAAPTLRAVRPYVRTYTSSVSLPSPRPVSPESSRVLDQGLRHEQIFIREVIKGSRNITCSVAA